MSTTMEKNHVSKTALRVAIHRAARQFLDDPKIFEDSLAYHVALAAEPFQTFFDPCSLKNTLESMGFGQIEDIEPEEMDARYFRGQTDKSRVGRIAHVIYARIR